MPDCKIVAVLAVACAAFLSTASAHAASLIVVLDNRSVSAGPQVRPEPGASLFSAESQSPASPATPVVDAYQDSTLGPEAFTGTGGFYASSGSPHSIFDVTFEVDEQTAYRLTGLINLPPGQASLTGLPGNLTGAIDAEGTFVPGVLYRLLIDATPGGFPVLTSGYYEFTLAIPEPSAAWLCTLAALAVLLLRRKLARREVA